MPLKYKELIMEDPTKWSTAETLVHTLLAQLQITSITKPLLTKQELHAVDRQIARLLTAPRGLLPEC